jgi:hypothetical protein
MFKPISDYRVTSDWWYILPAIIFVDLVAIWFGKTHAQISLNRWYARFGIFAVIADVLSIAIGILITRYIYTLLRLTNPLYFIGILLAVQLIHDTLFYLLVIQPTATGANQMIDIFKSYSKENGAKILIADALMVVGSAVLGSFLKGAEPHVTVGFGFLTVYILSYLIYAKDPS